MTVSKEKSMLKKIFRIPKLLLRFSIRITLKFGPDFVKKPIIYLFTDRLLRSRFNIILSYILAGEEDMYWRGINIRADTRDMHGMLLYLFNSYSGPEIEKLIEVCRGAKIFADVGANIGLISLSLAKVCPNLEIFAFEPDHNILDKFRQNLNLNSGLSGRIHLIEKAVTDIDGELFFQPSIDPKNIGLGKIIRQDRADPGSLRVPTVRFDNFFANIGRYPDVVKIDVEGEEGFVL
jgi:FkbM family methyltransferase